MIFIEKNGNIILQDIFTAGAQMIILPLFRRPGEVLRPDVFYLKILQNVSEYGILSDFRRISGAPPRRVALFCSAMAIAQQIFCVAPKSRVVQQG